MTNPKNTLSMDPAQATLIRTRDEKPGDNKEQLQAQVVRGEAPR